MASCIPRFEAARSPVCKTKENPRFPLTEIIVHELAGENVGMNDINTGGHESNGVSVPNTLIGCTDMGVFEGFSLAEK